MTVRATILQPPTPPDSLGSTLNEETRDSASHRRLLGGAHKKPRCPGYPGQLVKHVVSQSHPTSQRPTLFTLLALFQQRRLDRLARRARRQNHGRWPPKQPLAPGRPRVQFAINGASSQPNRQSTPRVRQPRIRLRARQQPHLPHLPCALR